MTRTLLVGAAIAVLAIFLISGIVSSPMIASAVSFPTIVNISGSSEGSTTYPFVANVGDQFYVAWSAKSGIFFRSYNATTNTWTPALVSSPMELSVKPSIGPVGYPVIAANASNVYVEFVQNNKSNSGLQQVFVAVSNNSGATFVTDRIGAPFKNINAERGEPSAAAWGSDVYLTWANYGVATYVVASQDNGSTWGSVIQMQGPREQQIAAYGHDAYFVSDRSNGQFLVNVTQNDGLSWTAHTINQPNINEQGVSEPWVVATGSSAYLVWHTKNPLPSTIFGAYTLDDGNTWTTYCPNTSCELNTTDGNYYNPQIALTGNGNVAMTYFMFAGSHGEIFERVLDTGTQTWGPATLLTGPSKTNWAYNVATAGSYVFTTYGIQSGSTTSYAYVSYSSDNGATWLTSPGLKASQNPSGTLAAPIDNNEGSVSVGISTSHALVAWEQNAGGTTSYQIYASISSLP